MTASNYTIYNDDPDRLLTLREEYESMGRNCKIEGNRLTVFSRPAFKAKPKREARPRRSE